MLLMRLTRSRGSALYYALEDRKSSCCLSYSLRDRPLCHRRLHLHLLSFRRGSYSQGLVAMTMLVPPTM
jgi:hypothetical protein